MSRIQVTDDPPVSIPVRPPSATPPRPVGDPGHDPDQGEPDEKEPLDLPEKKPAPDYDEEEPIDPDRDTLVEPLEPDEEDEGPVAEGI